MTIYLIWRLVGASVLAGVGVIVLFIPVQSLLSKAFGRLRLRMAKISDERIRLISQVYDAGDVAVS